MRKGLAVAALGLVLATAAAIPRAWAGYHQLLDFLGAMQNPYKSQDKVEKIRRQLMRYSGKSYTVQSGQQGTMGHAVEGGQTILLDFSTTNLAEDLLAFWLAHEWGHHVLGHTTRSFATEEERAAAMLRRAQFPTQSEDDADRYAAKFLAQTDYSMARVFAHLCRLGKDSRDVEHSSGPDRARIVQKAHGGETGRSEFSGSPCRN